MERTDVLKHLFSLVGFEPTPEQLAILQDETRHTLVSGGERAGKSLTNEKRWLVKYSTEKAANKVGKNLYWLLGDDYESCHGEWDYMCFDLEKLELLAKPPTKNIDPGEILLQDGTQIITKSARYKEKIATTAPDGIILCEAAQVDYDIYQRARARVAEKRGFLAMAGTFEEEQYQGWYEELWLLGQSPNELELKSFSLPTWSNKTIYPGGREDPEIKRLEASMTRERFLERFAGIPSPKTGRVISNFSNFTHIQNVAFNPDLPVEICVDPGYAGAYAVEALQDYGEQLAMIDEIYVTGLVTDDVILICKKQPWWNAVHGGAIDIAAKQHQAMAAPIEVWLSKGGIMLLTKKINIEDGIDLLNTHLRRHPVSGKPGIIVDPKCRGFISECGGGKSPVENGGTWMRHKDTNAPIDKNNHACKAIIYYLANKFGFRGEIRSFPEIRWEKSKTPRTFART